MCDDGARIEGKQGPWGLVVAVVWLLLGLCLVPAIFANPSTSYQGFTTDAAPTINDSGDIDCGGSSLTVVLRGPRVAIPPGDLAHRAEKACRDDAVDHIVVSVIGAIFLTGAGIRLVPRARRYRGEAPVQGTGRQLRPHGSRRFSPGKGPLRSHRLTVVQRR